MTKKKAIIVEGENKIKVEDTEFRIFETIFEMVWRLIITIGVFGVLGTIINKSTGNQVIAPLIGLGTLIWAFYYPIKKEYERWEKAKES